MNKNTKKLYIIAGFSFFVLLLWGLNYRMTVLQKVAGLSTERQQGGEIRGIILPHHELARGLINDSLIVVSKNKTPSRIVVFAPNHFSPGSYTVSTTEKLLDYKIDTGVIEKFKNKFPETLIDTKLLEQEHGATVPMKYLTNYFPEAQFIPLIFSPIYDEGELEEITTFISGIFPADTLYVLSLDFSHNTMVEEAMVKNQESINAITDFNYLRILEFEDDNLDSPVATVAFLKTMNKLDALFFEVWQNSHAALINDEPTLQGTSYVIGVFR